MAEPKKKLSHSRSGNRRSHLAKQVTKSNLTVCEKCKQKILTHHICPFCGYYRSKTVITKKAAK